MTICKVLEKPIHEIKPIKRNGHQGRTKAPRLQNFSFPSSFSQQPNTKKEIEREQNVWKPRTVRSAVGPRTVLSRLQSLDQRRQVYFDDAWFNLLWVERVYSEMEKTTVVVVLVIGGMSSRYWAMVALR
ncbi:hypothetical protein ACJW31_05G152000 [Castanea mollissima]